MEKKKQNEELQSRRDFFKGAAKKVLPIIGIAALMSNPVIAKAMKDEPMGCQYGCSGSCQGCRGTCTNACTGCGSLCRQSCSSGCAKNGY